MIFASAGNTLLVLIITRSNGRLIGGMAARERLWRTLRATSPGIAFALGLGLNLVGQQLISAFCWVLIPVWMFVAGVAAGPRRAKKVLDTAQS